MQIALCKVQASEQEILCVLKYAEERAVQPHLLCLS